MKKNVMMRLASFLLVAVLISTSAISGTYAKYTTQDSGKDEARVAKWGVELQVIGNLFGDSYDDLIVAEDDATVAVQSKNKSDDVVAPGTQNAEGFTFSLKGQPEVDGIVTTTMKIQNIFLKNGTYGIMIPVDANVVKDVNFDEFQDDLYKKVSNTFVKVDAYEETTFYTLEDVCVIEGDQDYYPVIYNLAGSTSYVGGIDTTKDTLAEVAKKIAANDRLNLTAGTAADDTSVTYTGSRTFESNTDLATWKLDGETLTWKWNFEKNADVGDDAHWTDKADTILGLLENTTEGTVVKLSGTSYVPPVEYTDYCLDTQFSIDITVTQVD